MPFRAGLSPGRSAEIMDALRKSATGPIRLCVAATRVPLGLGASLAAKPDADIAHATMERCGQRG